VTLEASDEVIAGNVAYRYSIGAVGVRVDTRCQQLHRISTLGTPYKIKDIR
jgi:hypothetical protein